MPDLTWPLTDAACSRSLTPLRISHIRREGSPHHRRDQEARAIRSSVISKRAYRSSSTAMERSRGSILRNLMCSAPHRRSADGAARQRFHVRSHVRIPRMRSRASHSTRLKPHPHKPFRFNRFLSSNFGCWSGTFNGQPVDLKEVPSGEPRLLCSTPRGVTCHPRHPLRSSAPKSESVAGPSCTNATTSPRLPRPPFTRRRSKPKANRCHCDVQGSAADDNCEPRPRGGRVQGAAGAAAQRGRSAAQRLDAAEHGGTMSTRRRIVDLRR